jgi:hypothetical protein
VALAVFGRFLDVLLAVKIKAIFVNGKVAKSSQKQIDVDKKA